jgi:ribosome-associated protein
MEDTLRDSALELGRLLEDHNGKEVIVMDMTPLNFWTDFFVIATVTSNTHLVGLERHIKDFVREKELEILHRSRRPDADVDDEWCLLDLGGIVIHLMTAAARDFFELERLWGAASVINKAPRPAHSSKSS